MRVTKLEVRNFGSYEYLGYDVSSKGLILVSGATGSGKSTLCDIIPWVLFGVTSKGGSVNDVVAWNSTAPATGTVWFEDGLSVTRIRNPNDLFLSNETSTSISGDTTYIRGKDLLDTQKLIDIKLGITANLYLSGAYFHEFSQLASFFTATAKSRRELVEQIVDLDLAVLLQERLSKAVSQRLKLLADVKALIDRVSHEIMMLEELAEKETIRHNAWQASHEQEIREIIRKRDDFDEDKHAMLSKMKRYCLEFERKREGDITVLLQDLTKSSKCPECGGPIKGDAHKLSVEKRIQTRRNQVNPYITTMSYEHDTVNTFNDQLVNLRGKTNPFDPAVTSSKLSKAKEKQQALEQQKDELLQETRDIDALLAAVTMFRVAVVSRTILEIESSTNAFLSKFFDAECKVNFTTQETDKLNITVWKNGNECAYSQLSKGQRQLLKLSFGVSIMQSISRRHGVHFNALFFDEALDGLDDQFKLKACRLLQTLEKTHETIFVVEHNAHIKDMGFDRRLHVELANGHSVIHEA